MGRNSVVKKASHADVARELDFKRPFNHSQHPWQRNLYLLRSWACPY
jgi:hypothetical protein